MTPAVYAIGPSPWRINSLTESTNATCFTAYDTGSYGLSVIISLSIGTGILRVTTVSRLSTETLRAASTGLAVITVFTSDIISLLGIKVSRATVESHIPNKTLKDAPTSFIRPTPAGASLSQVASSNQIIPGTLIDSRPYTVASIMLVTF